jgi:hypothetical protein
MTPGNTELQLIGCNSGSSLDEHPTGVEGHESFAGADPAKRGFVGHKQYRYDRKSVGRQSRWAAP